MAGFGAFIMPCGSPIASPVVVNSGSWNMAYWPAVRGTPLCIVNGVKDARPGVRWHYTDVEYPGSPIEILARALPHVYFETTAPMASPTGGRWFSTTSGRRGPRRDPFFDHVGLASPAGYRESYCYPARHNRWLSLDGAVRAA